MSDKETRNKRLQQAGRIVSQLQQEDTHGGVLSMIAAAPFSESDAFNYLINAILATGTPETLALAYELPLAAAQVLHSRAVANVTTEQPDRKTAGAGVASLVEAVKGIFRGEKDDCQCPVCVSRRLLDSKGSDGKPIMAFEFPAGTREEAEAMQERFLAELQKGRNPMIVAQELGGAIVDPVEAAERGERLDIPTQHIHMDDLGPHTKH